MIRRVALAALLSVLSARAVDASSFGRTAGNFNVSAGGSAQYSIPIWTPPGIRGVQPHLALIYGSQSSYGIMGPGWNLSGLSSIERCSPTYAQDGKPAPVTLTYADAFCLDGRRLRLTSSDSLSTYGQGGTTYQTEIANFSNVIASTALVGNGPQYFSVMGKDGLTYEYGNTTDSREIATGATTPYAWALDKVTDRYGNQMTFTYTQSNGSYVPATINFTAPSGSSTFPYQVTFTYTTRVSSAVINRYIANYTVQNTQQLSNINVTSSGTSVRQYNLTYTASPTTTLPTLTQVQECGGSAGTDCLSPTTVGYQGGAPGFAAPTTAAVSATAGYYQGGLVNSVDIDGDGKQDLVYAVTSGTNDQWYVQLATASGYGPAIYTGLTTKSTPNGPDNVVFDDFLGTGQNEILAPNGGMWTIYKYNGSGFTATSTGIAVDPNLYSGQVATADLDGDGLPDLITMPIPGLGNGTISWRKNTSNGTTVSFVSAATAIHSVINSQTLPQIRGNNGFPNSEVKHMRFGGTNSDGIVLESAVLEYPGGPVDDIVESLTYVNGSLATGIQTNGPMSYVLPLNFNDDACTDLATTSGIPPSSLSITTGCTSGLGNQIIVPYGIVGQVAAMDWDGDGRTDLIFSSGGALVVYRSQGNALSAAIPTGISAGTGSYLVFDKDGDGLPDLGFVNSSASNAVSYGLHNAAGVKPDLATAFTDGYGITYSPSYVPLSASGGIYTQGTSAVFPNQNYFGPRYVVSSYASSDGIGGTFNTSYTYAGAIQNLQGRGFQGFTTVGSTDSRTGLKDTRTYSTTFPNAGMLTAESLTQSAGTNVSVGTYALNSLTLDGTSNNQRYFPYTSSSSVNTYEVQVGGSYNGQLITTTAMNYGAPDAYGNFSSIEQILTDQDPGSPYFGQQWTSTVATTITANPGTWCNSLPTERDTTNTAPGVPSITRHLSFTPDYSFCRETQQVVESGNPTYQVTTAYGVDSFGNINSQTVTGVGMTARTSSINWGTTGQFPTTITNALNQTSHTSFDPNLGTLLSVQDPNGITTSWQYDSFGRKTKQIFPDSTSTTWAYNSCATAGCVNSNNRMTIDIGGDTIGHTYLDQLDRVLVTSKPMVDGTLNRIETQYDNLGNAHLQGMPCTFVNCVQYWTTNTYDILNRLTQSQRPINASNSTLQSTNYSYQGRSTITTDPLGHAVTQINLVTGAPYRTKDLNGYYINLNRDAFGSVLSAADSLGNTLRTMTYGYGLKAFRKTLTDTDLGSRTYTVDALGELIAYSDGKGQNFSANFDALSRMTSRTEPDLTTTWTWGTTAPSHNIGQLASVSSSSTSGTYTEAYTYDTAGRLSDRQFTIPNLGTLAFDYTYETTTGLLSTITYPSSFPSTFRLKAQFLYQYENPYVIEDAANPSTVWWRNKGMNPRGQIIGEDTMDSPSHLAIKAGHTYDAVTGWLSSNGAGAGTGSALQNESYQYDEVGNLIQRQNNNLGLTENIFYDGLYRLSTSKLNGSLNLSMTYASNGNILRRSDVASGATWTYDPTHIHQVTQAGSSAYTYSYDANGNVSARNGSIIGSTSYNYTNAISTSTESATFDYGPDRQRWRMVYSGPSGVETTYYATPMFEAVATGGGMDYRHYIYANGRPVVVISHTSTGAVNVRSLLLDQQGSISTIAANATGASYATESFTPFGNRREASTWSGTPTSTELNTMNGVTREGYTFQTVLGSMGLNHMNGRIEDSVTGRFLSADPRGIIRGNTQSWNRYSYVNNNPLSYTDPTGFADAFSTGDSLWDWAGFGQDYGGGGSPGGGSGGGGSEGGGDLQKLTNWLNAASNLITDALSSVDFTSGIDFNSGGVTVPLDNSNAAQSQDSTQSQTSGPASSGGLQEIVVTGSRISGNNDSSFNPQPISVPILPELEPYMQARSPRFRCTAPGCGAPHGGLRGNYCPECWGKSQDPNGGIPPDPNAPDDEDYPEQGSNPANQGQYKVPPSSWAAFFLLGFLGWLLSPN